jgi:hypothetical protein
MPSVRLLLLVAVMVSVTTVVAFPSLLSGRPKGDGSERKEVVRIALRNANKSLNDYKEEFYAGKRVRDMELEQRMLDEIAALSVEFSHLNRSR